ncbi:MAG: hypothetical protein ACJ789_10765 [Thermomicrobiales bacterium]
MIAIAAIAFAVLILAWLFAPSAGEKQVPERAPMRAVGEAPA